MKFLLYTLLICVLVASGFSQGNQNGNIASDLTISNFRAPGSMSQFAVPEPSSCVIWLAVASATAAAGFCRRRFKKKGGKELD